MIVVLCSNFRFNATAREWVARAAASGSEYRWPPTRSLESGHQATGVGQAVCRCLLPCRRLSPAGLWIHVQNDERQNVECQNVECKNVESDKLSKHKTLKVIKCQSTKR